MTESKILGVTFQAMDEAEAVSRLMDCLGRPVYGEVRAVVTPNPEAVMRARREPGFAEALNGAYFRFADGTGIVLASKLTRSPIPCRLRGYDTVIKLFNEISKRGRKTSAYFLGGSPGDCGSRDDCGSRGDGAPCVAEAAACEMERQFPCLTVVGFHDGFFSASEEKLITDEIKTLQPDILIIGMGMPRQEQFAFKHRDLPVKLVFCLGGSLDIMAGRVKLAPPAFRKLGLEWLYRLATQPSRAKRMLALPKFAALVLWRFVWPFASIED